MTTNSNNHLEFVALVALWVLFCVLVPVTLWRLLFALAVIVYLAENDIPIEDKIPATPDRVKTVKRAAQQGLYTPLHITKEAMEQEEHEERKETRRRHWDTEKDTEEEAQALCNDYVSTLPTDRIPQLTNEDWKLVVRQETKVIQNNDKYRFYWILYAGTPRQASVLRTRLGTCRHSEGGAALMILSLSKKKESSE